MLLSVVYCKVILHKLPVLWWFAFTSYLCSLLHLDHHSWKQSKALTLSVSDRALWKYMVALPCPTVHVGPCCTETLDCTHHHMVYVDACSIHDFCTVTVRERPHLKKPFLLLQACSGLQNVFFMPRLWPGIHSCLWETLLHFHFSPTYIFILFRFVALAHLIDT